MNIFSYVSKISWIIIEEIISRLTGNVELHLGGILAVDVAHDDLVSALIVGLRLPHAEGDRVGFRIREELEAATLDDLGDALVELESWRGCTLHRDGEVRRRVYRAPRELIINYFS